MIFMEMYVLQVKSGHEKSAAESLKNLGFLAYCPTRMQEIRFKSIWHKVEKIIFSQYIFVKCELTDDVYYKIKSVTGIVRFVGFGSPEALRKHEKEYVKLLNNDGKPIEPSKIFVTVNGDKMIISGILRQYQDKIISLDLRQKRAKIELEISGKVHRITLPVTAI